MLIALPSSANHAVKNSQSPERKTGEDFAVVNAGKQAVSEKENNLEHPRKLNIVKTAVSLLNYLSTNTDYIAQVPAAKKAGETLIRKCARQSRLATTKADGTLTVI
jgi:hypothetical protein